MRFSKAEMAKVEMSIRNFAKTNDRLPNYATMVEMDTNKPVKLNPAQYCGLYYSDYIFWLKNGRFPNYVTLNILKDSPMIMNHQDNGYTCGPASLSMVSTKLFKPMPEGVMGQSGLALLLGTNRTSGTPEPNMVSGGAKAGFKISVIGRNPTAVAEALKQYKGVLNHYQTGPADCSGFQNDYGHWCVIKSVANGRYTIWDPTRGIYTCATGEMDRATNGRKINYFSVEVA